MSTLRTLFHGPAARLAVACAVAIGGNAAAAAPPPQPPPPLVIAATQSPLSLLVHIADQQGLFAAEGVAVRTTPCLSGDRCLDQVFDKTAQFATMSELPVVLNGFTRDDFAIVATIGRAAQGILLVGRKSAGIRSPADLRGKRVGVQLRSSSHYFLDACLLFNGVDPKQVQLVAMESRQVAEALANRQVDAVVTYDRRKLAALTALGSDAVVLEDPHIYTATVNLVVDRGTLTTRRADVVKVLRALAQAGRWMTEQPDKVGALVRARMDDPAATEATLRKADLRLGIEQSLVSTMEGEARWALREGHVKSTGGVPNFLRLLDAGPLREAVPSAGR